MQQDYATSANDEIDLRELILGLWRGKWLIVVVVAISLALALAYLLLVPQSRVLSLKVHKIDTFEAAPYMALEQSEFLSVNADNLAIRFFENPLPVLKNKMKQLGYVVKQSDETDTEYLDRLGEVAAEFEFLPPFEDLKGKSSQPHWLLKMGTTTPDLARHLVAEVLAEINLQIKSKLQHQYHFNIQQYELDLANQLEDANIALNGKEQVYKANLTSLIAELSEQAQIARSLDIEGNQLLGRMTGKSDMVVLANQKLPTYLNGYIALEKEIALLKNRGSNTQTYMKDLDDLRATIYKLENDQTVVRAQKLYAQTSLGGEEFSAVRYDIHTLHTKTKTSPPLIIVLAAILGGMLGVMILIMRNLLRSDS